jgi:hypothetical protein
VTCRACGAEIADKAIVCYKCGTPTAEEAVRPSARGHAGPNWLLVAILLLVLSACGWYASAAPAGSTSRWMGWGGLAVAAAGLVVTLLGGLRRR